MGDDVSALSVLHVICPQPAGSVGGTDLHVLDLAEQQLRRQMRVSVLPLGNAVYQHRITARGARLPDVPGLWSPSFVPALARELRDECIDIVHGHGYSADLMAILAVGLARRLNAPSGGAKPALVFTAHGFIRSTWSTRVRSGINERCLRFADAIIATSRREAGRLTRRLATGEVHYVPNGIRAPVVARTPERAEPPRHLAYVGRLAPEKRADLFLLVAAELASIYPDLRVSVMGAGPLAKPLRSLAQRLGIGERCEFTGLVDDVEERLRHVEVLVSLSDTEGTPRAILEAMSMGVTVVATEVGGVPELIINGRTGLLVPTGPATVPAAVAALRSLLADPGRLRAISGAASEAVRSEFLIEGMAERTRAIYDSILPSSPRKQRSA